ncbi:hypothetical protein FXF50_12200 [Micromonospora sp. AP08]|uniref:hypothetical protein n=1 Tax=Micromonospora sp. AP08 TaxID=2604467 RepID=UPI0011D912E8|nr:hypothetical protein [Micromonospora sp. AP08]TYB37689.1 hypothetical protein FXF50_12200 [Micromonospora sp. AP08]
MTFDDDRYLGAFVDFSRGHHFVRLDVEVPGETLTEGLAGPDDNVPHGSLWLSADRAEALARALLSCAAEVRKQGRLHGQ